MPTRNPLPLITMILLLVPSTLRAQDPPLPIQDNELILGVGLGPIFVDDVNPDPRAERRSRVGIHLELELGLMNRATSWLDGEIAIHFAGFYLAQEGFRQVDRGDLIERNFLPGAQLRASGMLHLPAWPWLRLGTGLLTGIFAAPALGTLARLDIEALFSVELMRDAEHHLSLISAYGIPLVDDLNQETGMTLTGHTHRLTLRLTYGF